MKTEQPSGLRQLDDYASDHWVEVSSTSTHNSPLQEYNGFGFVTPLHIPLDSVHDHPQGTSYSPPRPQFVPQWPSQITNPSQGPPPPSMPMARPLAPATSVSPMEPPSATASEPTPGPTPHAAPSNARKTLTDNDRRKMCQYHEEYPNVKQTEIGAIFGVERSTVSKVLRQKEKFLAADDGSQSSLKRSKGKFPDIERALSIWARNHQKQGLPLDDDLIRDKARFFAHTVGSSECHAKVKSAAWLEKFKQKNSLLGAKPVTGVSDMNDMDLGEDIPGIHNTHPNSGSETPNALSPTSPDIAVKSEQADGYMDFSASYRPSHSESATSLISCYSETTVSTSFSPDLRSPTSPFFSPDSSCGPSPLIPSQSSRLPRLASAASRPRRQTFPAVGAGTFVPEPGSEAPPLRYTQSTMAVPTLESPLEEMDDSSLGIDTTMHPSSQPASHQTTPIMPSSPSSMALPLQNPSQDEARRAMETVMAFFQNQPVNTVDPQEYFLIGKLMEKLKLRDGSLPGGMHSLDHGDVTLNMNRKRSIHSL